jgi:glutathione S-transferase
MLKIYGRKTSSNVQKVLWCCTEIGLPFERSDVGGPFGNNRTPGYLALNPNGLVPTIDEDGFILWESNAVVRYLAAKHALGTLCPRDLAQRADADRWMDWQQTVIAVPMGVAFRAMLKNPPDAVPEDQLRAAIQKAGEVWAILDARLAGREFVCGAALTMADIALGNAVHRWFKLAVTRPELPHLKRWYERLCTRAAYREHVASV